MREANNMSDNNHMNRFRVSDEVVIAAIDMLGKVLLALIAARGSRQIEH